MKRICRRGVLAGLALLGAVRPLAAAAAADRPMLTVVDAASGRSVTFDRAGIDALEQHEIRTHTEFTPGLGVFRGPRAIDVLERAGVGAAEQVRLVAANDYSVTVPVSDFRRYGVIMATEFDGKRLSLRDRGPLWMIYPLDDHPELRGAAIVDRLIWQLVRVEVK